MLGDATNYNMSDHNDVFVYDRGEVYSILEDTTLMYIERLTFEILCSSRDREELLCLVEYATAMAITGKR